MVASRPGVMSFLKIGDRAAGAIKSGGTTRRAAKMVILDVDHPDIERFIDWKKVEEDKARVLIDARWPTRRLQRRRLRHRLRPELEQLGSRLQRFHPDRDRRRRLGLDQPHRRLGPQDGQGPRPLGQDRRGGLGLRRPRSSSSTPPSTSGTPPPPAAGSAQQTRARSTCSSTTPRATWPRSTWSGSYDDETGVFDVEAYHHAVRLWTIVLEISVTMAHFPSPGDRPGLATTTAPSASATPTSARC